MNKEDRQFQLCVKNPTCGSCTTANIHVVFFIKLDANSLSVSSRDATSSTPAQRDGYHAIDICKHDGYTNAL